MAAFGYYTGTAENMWSTESTASSYSLSLSDHSFAREWPKQYFCRGLEFESQKEATAYDNMIKSREIAQDLSFFVPRQKNLCPYKRVKPRLTALSLKQVAYSKRKKLKEKLGLKH